MECMNMPTPRAPSTRLSGRPGERYRLPTSLAASSRRLVSEAVRARKLASNSNGHRHDRLWHRIIDR